MGRKKKKAKSVNPIKVMAQLMHHDFYSKDCKAMSVVYGGKKTRLTCCKEIQKAIDQSLYQVPGSPKKGKKDIPSNLVIKRKVFEQNVIFESLSF